MKLLDLYDHPSFKLSIKTEIVRQSLVDILKSFSFSCSTKSSKDAISKAANKIVTVNKRLKLSKDKFRRHELSFLESFVIPEHLSLGGGPEEKQQVWHIYSTTVGCVKIWKCANWEGLYNFELFLNHNFALFVWLKNAFYASWANKIVLL